MSRVGRPNLILGLLRLYTPAFLKARLFDELTSLTAAAFGANPPAVGGLPFGERLRCYALFTKDQVEGSIHRGQDMEVVEGRLYEGAYRLGGRLSRALRVSTMPQALVAARLLYRAIGIDLRASFEGTDEATAGGGHMGGRRGSRGGVTDGSRCGSRDGRGGTGIRSRGRTGATVDVVIGRCFFSRFYSGDVCRVMSSVDRGIVAGLSGGQMVFSQRITDGQSCCRASLAMDSAGEVPE